MWGWGGDKTEVVNGYECKVYTASGVEVLTKTRVEHLSAEDKQVAQSEFISDFSFLNELNVQKVILGHPCYFPMHLAF